VGGVDGSSIVPLPGLDDSLMVDARSIEYVAGRLRGWIQVTMDMTDYPRLLVVDEGFAASTPTAVPAALAL